MLDIKITGGRIADGSGQPAYLGDVGIRDGRIVAVGTVAEDARETIDATGRIVAPGFIDVHTHYDAQAFWDPTFSPSCYHGVTTVFGGFCGFSIAPLTPDAGAYLLPMLARVEGMPQETLKAGVPWSWSSFGDFLGLLEGKVGLNCGFFVGHSAVRRVVMGERAVGSLASEAEIAEMSRLVHASLDEGAMGFSSTVSASHNDADGNPVPSRHASREELIALAATVRDHPGTSLELLPNLDFGEDTLELLKDFSLAGQRPVNWNVLNITGTSEVERERMDRMLSASTYARQHGAEVVALMPPSTFALRLNFMSGFVLDFLPGWAALFRISPAERLERLKDPFVRALLREAAASSPAYMATTVNFARYKVVEVQAEANKRYEGKLVSEIAAERGVDVFDALIDLVIADGLRTSFQPEQRGEDVETYALRKQLVEDDRILIGASDAGAHMDMIDSFAFSTKLLQRSREYGLASVERAVQLMTQVPAEYFGLLERGEMKIGYHADVVVFDPETVATGEVYTRYDLPGTREHGRLYADAIGIDAVVVNGTLMVRDNVTTGALPGKVLRSGKDTETVAIPRFAAAA